MWNITSNPVIFGNTAELSCFIFNYDTTCTDELRQWIGGQHYNSLCQNMRCSDDTKYHVKLRTACSYTLMISNFSIDDVNCDYACFYGTHSYRKHLQLNSNDFVCMYTLLSWFRIHTTTQRYVLCTIIIAKLYNKLIKGNWKKKYVFFSVIQNIIKTIFNQLGFSVSTNVHAISALISKLVNMQINFQYI